MNTPAVQPAPQPSAPPSPEQVAAFKADIGKRVGQYVKLRDEIKRLDDAHKELMKPYRETLEKLNSVLLDHLNGINAESAATTEGTVYKTKKASASVKDMSAFWTYVVTQALWDLLDKKANVTGVEEFIKKNGMAPPGVNYNVTSVAGVRRK